MYIPLAVIVMHYLLLVHTVCWQVEEEEPTGFVRYEKFEPVLCRILLERRYQPVSEEQLLKAFKVIIYILITLCVYVILV